MKFQVLVGLIAIQALHSASAALAVVGTEAKNGGYVYDIVVNKPTVEVAKKIALAQCKQYVKKEGHKNNCRVVIAHEGPAYVAVFDAAPGNPDSFGVGVSANRQTAVERAYQECSGNGRIECIQNYSALQFDGGPTNISEAELLARVQSQPVVQQPAANSKTSYLDERTRAIRCQNTFISRFDRNAESKAKWLSENCR